MATRLFLTTSLFFLCALRALSGEPALSDRIAPIAKAHKGRIAVAVRHLETGEGYTLNADEVMPTASLIKLPIMFETYWQAAEGKVKLDTMLTLKKEDKVPGSGILTNHFSDGASFPLRDAVRLMMVYSDNTATNLVLDQIGIPSTNERMEKLGLANTKINAKVFKGSTTSISPERTKKYGLGSTTAGEMVKLLELLQAEKVATPDACKQMFGHLKACDDKDKMTRFLPEGTVVAHKTGSLNAAKTDAGIIYLPDAADKKKTHPVALCVMTDGNADQRWVTENAAQVAIAKIAREVYDYFASKKE
jgi:beta-lactamase class A